MMSKIIVGEDNSLENLEIKLDHILLKEADLTQEVAAFKPLDFYLDEKHASFVPLLITQGKLKQAADNLTDVDELELFFSILISDKSNDELCRLIKSHSDYYSDNLAQDLMAYLFFSSKEDERKKLLSQFTDISTDDRTPLSTLIIALYGDQIQKQVSVSSEIEDNSAVFVEALKLLEQKNDDAGFVLLLSIFERADYPLFVYKLLRFYLAISNELSVKHVKKFIDMVLKSSLNISFTQLKFIEFLYYYKNNMIEELETCVSSLGESTESLFILNTIAPLLYQYKLWNLLSKFYKIASRNTEGEVKTAYLEMLADTYENKMNMPDLATEIHKRIVEENPASSSISFSRVISVYEENNQWQDLYKLLQFVGEREKEQKMKAYYYYKAGIILFHEMKKHEEAKILLERSFDLNSSFEVIRELSQLYRMTHDYDAYIRILVTELKLVKTDGEKIRILDLIAENYLTYKMDYEKVEYYLQQILEIEPNRIQTLRKLGRLYYLTKQWEKLAHINTMEINCTENIRDIINLLYKNGTLYFNKMKDIERSKVSFLEILSLEKDHIPTLLYLEKIYIAEQNISQLSDLYRQLINSSSSDSTTKEYYMTRLAIIYRDHDQLKEAYDTFKSILYLYPQNTLAKENIRMLNNDIEFKTIEQDTSDYPEFLELSSSVIEQTNKKSLTNHLLEHDEADYWHYLYHKKINNSATVDTSLLSPDEQLMHELIENNISIDTLVKNSNKNIAIVTLAEKYIEKGFYRGIFSILTFYLKLNPETKRLFWNLFFMGRDNPALKEKLESLLVTEKEFDYFEITLNILEKIYLKEKDYHTVLFLRSLFIKKLQDTHKKIQYIDNTISFLSSYLSNKELLDLYKTRYKCSTGEDKREFLNIYRKILEKEIMIDTLISIYQELWQDAKNFSDGMYLLNLYRDNNNIKEALKLAKELLEKDPSNNEVFLILMLLYRKTESFDTMIKDLKIKISKTNDAQEKENLENYLLDIYYQAGYTDEALTFFNSRSFPSLGVRLDKAFIIAESLEHDDRKTEAIDLIKSIAVFDEEHAIKKITFLLKRDQELNHDDLAPVSSFLAIADLVKDKPLTDPIKNIITYFSSKGDLDAAEIMITQLLKENRINEAEAELEKIKDKSEKSAILLSLVYKHEGDFNKERELLFSIILSEMKKHNYYPVLRLLDLLQPGEERGSFFLKNLLHFFNPKQYHPATNEWDHLTSVKKDTVFNTASFDELDYDLLSYAQLLSKATNPEKSVKQVDLNPTKYKKIIDLVNSIAISMRSDPVPIFLSDNIETAFTIKKNNIPVLLFSPVALSADRKKLAFLLIQNIFLMQNGVTDNMGKSGIKSMVNNLKKTLGLTGKSKVKFIRALKTNYQSTASEKIDKLKEIDHLDIENMGNKLFFASLFFAFSIIPDISLLAAMVHQNAEHINYNDTMVKKCFTFALNHFFQ